MGINICADSWNATAPRAARDAGANVLLVLNASPYHMDKQRVRYDVMRERVAENGMALVYAYLVGGQDELRFPHPRVEGERVQQDQRAPLTTDRGGLEISEFTECRQASTVRQSGTRVPAPVVVCFPWLQPCI